MLRLAVRYDMPTSIGLALAALDVHEKSIRKVEKLLLGDCLQLIRHKPRQPSVVVVKPDPPGYEENLVRHGR